MKKKCSGCKQEKTIDNFYKDKGRVSGYNNYCKPCKNLINRKSDKKTGNNKRWIMENYERSRGYERGLEKDPRKSRARRTAQRAVKNGHLRRMPCLICDDPNSHAHHEDYSKPLDVVWLCTIHHVERHVELRDKGIVL